MTVTSSTMDPEQPTQPLVVQQQQQEEVKSAISRETAKAQKDAFSRLRGLSSSFTKTRASHARKVSFDPDRNRVHEVPALTSKDRDILFLSYKDKISIADDVEETCYRFGDNDTVHPYMKHLDTIWHKCGSSTTAQITATGLDVSDEDLVSLVNTRGRGMEKKLIVDMKRNRDSVVKQVLDAQSTYRVLPVGSDQRAKMLKSKYKKLTNRSKVFALTVANGDTLVSSSYNNNAKKSSAASSHTNIAATSA